MFIISKNCFLIKKTAFVIYQILVNRENDANKEKESATLRRRKNLDFKSSKGKSADFTDQNCFGLFGKIKEKTVDRTCVTKVLQKSDQLLAFSKADPELERTRLFF